MKNNNADRMIGLCCAIVALIWAALLINKFFNFAYYDWDLAFFAQAMHNLTQGELYSSLFQKNFFANHANLISFVILPIYVIFHSPMTLVFLKLFSVVGAGWIVYLFAREKIGRPGAILVLMMFFFYPPNVFGILYEFDMEALAPIFCAGLYYAFVKERWRWFLFCAVILVLIKENLPLIVCAAGVAGLVTKKEKLRWGIVPLVLGAVAFFISVYVVTPFFAGRGVLAQHSYFFNYARYGTSLLDVTWNFIRDPYFLFVTIFSPRNISWLQEVLGVLLFVPLLGFQVMFFVLPIMLQHMLSASFQSQTIFYSYTLTIAPFIFLAFVSGLAIFRRYFPTRVFFLVSICFILVSVALQFYWPQMTRRYMPSYVQAWTTARYEILSKVPAQAPVVASFPFLAVLSQRSGCYPFYKVYNPDYNKEKLWDVPSSVRFALIDESDPWYQNLYRAAPEQTQKLINNFKERGEWKETASIGPIHLWQR